MRVQVATGGEDRVTGIVHVPTSIGGPGGRHELHRTLRPGGTESLDAPHVGLDQVDGGEVLPGRPGGLLRLVVVPHQDLSRRRRDDSPVGQRAAGAVEAIDLLRGRQVVLHGRSNRGRNVRQHGRHPVRVGGQQVVGALLAVTKRSKFDRLGVARSDGRLDIIELAGDVFGIHDDDPGPWGRGG